MIEQLFSKVLEISISMSVLICFLLCFGKQLRKLFGPNWRLFAFVIIYIRMFIPINSSLLHVPIEFNFSNNLQFFSILSYIWVAGIIALTAYFITRYTLFRRMIRHWGQPSTSERVSQCLRRAKFETDIYLNPKVYFCKLISSPITSGMFNKIIVLPNDDYTDTELEAIFRHELVHCKHYDVLRKAIGLINSIIYWFCPFVWMMANAMNRDAELSCDTEVVYRSGESYRLTYGKTILTSIAREIKSNQHIKTPLIAAFNGKKAFLKTRIKNITRVKTNKNGMTSLIVFSTVTIVITIFVSIII